MSKKIKKLANRFSYVLHKMSKLNKKADNTMTELSDYISAGLIRDIPLLAYDMYQLKIPENNFVLSVKAEFNNSYKVEVTTDFQNTEMGGGQSVQKAMSWLGDQNKVKNLVRVVLSLTRKHFSTWPKMRKEDGTLQVDRVFVKVNVKADGKVVFVNNYTVLSLI